MAEASMIPARGISRASKTWKQPGDGLALGVKSPSALAL